MESRRRPLRTYSKHTSSTESSEPTPKRQRLASSPVTSIRDKEPKAAFAIPEQSDTALSSQSLLSTLPLKKGTITAYFGRIVPQPPLVVPSSDPPSDPLSEPSEPESTPPLSPPIVSATRKRKARRLKTRVSRRRLDEEGSDESQENQDDDGLIGTTSGTKKLAHARATDLSEATPNALNRNRGVTRTGLVGSKLQENRRRERKPASVQTTLSLSMRETHYTECKGCGMLYNHLHESDVKYHARRHASLRRAKARADTRSDAIE